MIAVGDMAPDFTLPAIQADGDSVTLSAFRPQRVVLFFYPKDSTPACTDEARGFSERATDFARAGVALLGVSKDSLRRHSNFAQKQGLTVPLASDADQDVCERYGVWAEKSMFGRAYMGIVRTTLLINRDGRVARIWSPVSVPGHVEDVLKALDG